jgi:hypothetical protein
MPNGKPAGVRCVNLSENNECMIFGQLERPRVCGGFTAERMFCGDTDEEAIEILSSLEE